MDDAAMSDGSGSRSLEAIEHFPGQNPHPVMRIDDDGLLTYANPSSMPLVAAIGATVGERLSNGWRQRIETAADDGKPIEVAVGVRTFELLIVRAVGLGFSNAYGTDVTAARAIAQFPDQNPNPVFRLAWDGMLTYANPASADLVSGLDGVVGSPFPDPPRTSLVAAARMTARETVEVVSHGRRYALLAVEVPGFDFINVYGTDITHVHELEELHRENERLLLSILPEPIAGRLRRGERLIADRFDDVTLMFADIVDFTRLSSGMAAIDLVGVLNEVFGVFDGLVEAAGLEKIKTIGDAYMVVGGLTDGTIDHTAAVARLAMTVGQRVDGIAACRRLGISFRIGIHAGPVVAGVIGERKFIYDVWGDTVNVASRMESTGVADRIQVSAAVEERLRGAFVFQPRGLVEVKGKGPMETFLLVGEADHVVRS